MDGTITSWKGCLFTFLTVVFFELIHFVVYRLPLPEKVAQTRNHFKIFRWQNLVVSWVHACIAGVWTYTCFVVYGVEMYDDMMAFINWPTYGVCCFTTGYFIYDTLDILQRDWSVIKQKWEILIHHTAIIVCAWHNILFTFCIGYHVLSMSIELNTSFLHSRKLLQLSGWLSDSHPISQFIRYVNLVTFGPLRLLPCFLMIRAAFVEGHRVVWWYLIVYSLSCVVLAVVNCILYYRLLMTDVFANVKSRKLNTDNISNNKNALNGVLPGAMPPIAVESNGHVKDE